MAGRAAWSFLQTSVNRSTRGGRSRLKRLQKARQVMHHL